VGDGDIEMGDADADANVVKKKAEAQAAKKTAVEAAQARKKAEAEAQAKRKAEIEAGQVKRKAEAAAAKAKKKAAAAAKRTVVPDSDDTATDLEPTAGPPTLRDPTRTGIARARGAHLTVNTGTSALTTTTRTTDPLRTPATPTFESDLARHMRQLSPTLDLDPARDNRRLADLQPDLNSDLMKQASGHWGDQPARIPLVSAFLDASLGWPLASDFLVGEIRATNLTGLRAAGDTLYTLPRIWTPRAKDAGGKATVISISLDNGDNKSDGTGSDDTGSG
jgi:hypothetical protein